MRKLHLNIWMNSKLKAKTIRVASLKPHQIEEMFKLFEIFYENVSFERFRSDLLQKSRVIIMIDKNKSIQGFSTLYDFDLTHEGTKFRILFSGDTIIAPDFWGTSVLTMEFLKNIILLKLKYFNRPVWWFLISKGYKTYLLLANNFINYYPRYDLDTPANYQDLLKKLSDKFYPNKFNSISGVIEFAPREHEYLKESIAPITEELMNKFPKIKFFNEKNPNWKVGHELACIGRVDLALAFVHPFKILNKSLRKSLKQK